VVSPITQAAVQNGVLTCSSKIDHLSKFIVGNNKSGAFLFAAKNSPDSRMFSASIEVCPEKNLPFYTSMSFAPIAAGGVEAVYDTIEYIPQPRDEVAKQYFKDAKLIALKEYILFYEINGVRVFLMPAGKDGCVMIKKEVIR